MTVYNFTVRSTDNANAFADRDFSINVRNTYVGFNPTFIASGSQIYSSNDGVAWSTVAGVSGDSVAYGNGQWIVYTKFTTNQTYYLYDRYVGEWQTCTRPAFYVNAHHRPSIAYGNGQWMTFGTGPSGYNQYCYTSTDGINWTHTGTISNTVASIPSVGGAIAYGNGKWIAAYFVTGASSISASGGWFSDDNGATWSELIMPQAGRISDCLYANEKWVLVDNSASTWWLWSSTNGATWTKITLPQSGGPAHASPWKITLHNGIWFASISLGNNYATGWYSYDSINWQYTTSGGTTQLTQSYTASAIGKIITVSPTGVYYSIDGANWNLAQAGAFTGIASKTLG